MPEAQDLERPVDEQQDAAVEPAAGEVIDEQDDHHRDHGDLHRRVGHHLGAAQVEVGARPLDEQALVLPPHRRLRAVGADREEPEERVEVEARQGAGVVAHPQVPLLEPRQQHERHADRQRRGDGDDRQAPRIEPDDAGQGEEQLAGGAHEPLAEVGHQAEAVDAVAALGHVGGQAALEVAVAEARELARNAIRSRASRCRPRRSAPRTIGRSRSRKRATTANSMPSAAARWAPSPSARAEVEEGAEEERLDDHPQPGDQQRQRQRARREAAAGGEQAEQLPARPRRRLGEGGGQLGRERARRGGLGAGVRRAAAADAHQDGAAEQHLLLAVRRPAGRAAPTSRPRARPASPRRRSSRQRARSERRSRPASPPLASPPAATSERVMRTRRRARRASASRDRPAPRSRSSPASPGEMPSSPRTPAGRRGTPRSRPTRARPPPAPPCGGGRRSSEEPARRRPAAPGGRVHHLDERAVAAPDDDEVGQPARVADDHDRRQAARLRQQQVVARHHDLLGLEAELRRDLLHRVDRGAVEVGLAGLAQAAVAHRDAEAFEQRLERRRPAVHRRGLDDLGGEEGAAGRRAGHAGG